LLTAFQVNLTPVLLKTLASKPVGDRALAKLKVVTSSAKSSLQPEKYVMLAKRQAPVNILFIFMTLLEL
jgi:hypothetical protein